MNTPDKSSDISPRESSPEFFETKYRAAPNADPWRFATAAYELRRYDAVMQALAGTGPDQGRRYARAFEPGCSVGVLTQRLATLCDAVDACDFSPTAAAAASARCSSLPGVTVRCAALTPQEPWAAFDLIVLCEIGYYFTAAQWQTLVQNMTLAMRPGTILLACHWLGHSEDHAQSGDDVHAALENPLLHPALSERHEGFRLERWTRAQ